jgi:hypothetical protein
MNEIVYGEEKNIKPNEPTKEGPISFVLFESPFTSASTVSRGHHSLVSLLMVRNSERFFKPGILAWPFSVLKGDCKD